MTARTAKRTSGRRVVAIVAHPDDEVLGCGGTLRHHALIGDDVTIIALADGETSRDAADDPADAVARRSASAQRAAAILGAKHLEIHALPDNRLDGELLLDIVKIVERHLRQIQPQVVYTHHAGDVNIDHRRAHEAVVTACRPQSGQVVETLLFFETPSSTEWQPPFSAPPFVPNWFVDISETLDVKLKALKAYEHEMRDWPHPRSYRGVEHLARWRGATIGSDAAEAFILGRKIQRQPS